MQHITTCSRRATSTSRRTSRSSGRASKQASITKRSSGRCSRIGTHEPAGREDHAKHAAKEIEVAECETLPVWARSPKLFMAVAAALGRDRQALLADCIVVGAHLADQLLRILCRHQFLQRCSSEVSASKKVDGLRQTGDPDGPSAVPSYRVARAGGFVGPRLPAGSG